VVGYFGMNLPMKLMIQIDRSVAVDCNSGFDSWMVDLRCCNAPVAGVADILLVGIGFAAGNLIGSGNFLDCCCDL
jgi:hypothetical protein